MTAHTIITAPCDPAFVTIADAETDVSHNGEDYRAYFSLGDYADAPRLLGVMRYGDDMPMPRDMIGWLLGAATVLRWEGLCPVPDAYDPDEPEQRGYDAARERSQGGE